MKPLLTLLLSTLFILPAHPQDKALAVALITKAANRVEFRNSAASTWAKAKAPCELTTGCEVRTGDNSLALITFTDTSRVTLRPQSVSKIVGEISAAKLLNRGLSLAQGRIMFSVKEQKTGEFRLESPVSLTSIQAGEGSHAFDPITGVATISILEGSANIQHTGTGRTLHLKSGQTATVDKTSCTVQ